jgi:hypothetical protein
MRGIKRRRITKKNKNKNRRGRGRGSEKKNKKIPCCLGIH